MSHESQMSQTVSSNQATLCDQTVHDSQALTGYQELPSREMPDNHKLSYDWERILLFSKWFKIPNSEDYANSMDDETSNDFLVPEPPSISGIMEGTTHVSSSSKTTTDKEENFIVDNMSSLSSVSDIKVSNAPKKHMLEKERVERVGNINDKLYNACLKGQINLIKDILENHKILLTPDEQRQTPLYAVCIGNHFEVVSLLIDFRYDVNHQDHEGNTPLHIAFENHTPDLAKILITQFKANIEIRNILNWTPLPIAIDRGYFNYSNQLSQKFLHQDVSKEISWIQLHAACNEENIKNVEILLDANTDVNRDSSAGHTPLHIAVTKSNIDLVTLLLNKNVDVDSVTIDGKTPLHIAVEKSEGTIIQKLLVWKANPNIKDAIGNTSLHLAAQLKQNTKPRLTLAVAASVDTDEMYDRDGRCHFPAFYQSCSSQTVQALIKYGAVVNEVNNRHQTALWFACCDGQVDLVKILLDTGTDLNIVDDFKDSSLHAAVYGHCNPKTVQKLIDHGARVNAVNKDGATPLLLACSRAQMESVRLLLKANADLDITYADGDSCLHAAIAGDCSKETVQEIIDYGADVNGVNKRGRTALLFSCFYRQMDSVKVLLAAGADPTIADEEGFTCLYAAVDGRCNTETLQALIDHGAHVDAKRKDGTNALMCACRTGQSEIVKFLLEAGADVNITNANGSTSLHVAIIGDCSNETLEKIVQQGAAVNAMGNRGKTALIHACESAKTESVKLLLKKGADPNISDDKGYTSLHAVVSGRCTDNALEDLITHGAYLDAQNKSGKTALWLACSDKKENSIKILLTAGSNPNIADNNGYTSLHVAIGCKKKIIKAIIDHGTHVNARSKSNMTALMMACEKRNEDAVNVLLAAGSNPNIAFNGLTCLHTAVFRDCSKEALQAIISHRVDMNTTNEKNITALMVACRRGNLDAVNEFLNAEADPTIEDGLGATWIHHAVGEGCSKEFLQAIIDHGADVNAANKKNITALMLACKKGNEGCINILLNAGADPNIADDDGYTCLHYAADRDCSKEAFQAIITHGPDVNARNKNNTAALMTACKKGNTTAINIIMNAGADPNIADNDGYTCLHYAADGDCSEKALQAMIGHGADVNATSKENGTALMTACSNGNAGAINILLNAGADSNIADIDGNTCLHYIADEDCSRVALQAIIAHGTDVNTTNKENVTPLMTACNNGNAGAINILMNAGADPNIADHDGYTCLHYVALDGSEEALQAIIAHGADVNAANKENVTALMTACGKGNTCAINILMNVGADPNIADNDGYTCLHYVTLDCNKEALQAVINHGVDLNTRNKENVTALMTACREGNTGAINILINAGADPNSVDVYGRTWIHHAILN